jgi:hypothetical protein
MNTVLGLVNVVGSSLWSVNFNLKSLNPSTSNNSSLTVIL